jgi:hypothetical protein
MKMAVHKIEIWAAFIRPFHQISSLLLKYSSHYVLWIVPNLNFQLVAN